MCLMGYHPRHGFNPRALTTFTLWTHTFWISSDDDEDDIMTRRQQKEIKWICMCNFPLYLLRGIGKGMRNGKYGT